MSSFIAVVPARLSAAHCKTTPRDELLDSAGCAVDAFVMATGFGGVLLRRHIAKACTETRWQCSAAKHTQQQAQDLIMQILKPVQAADWA